MRVRKKKWAENELLTNSLVLKDAFAYKGNWGALFGNNNPIYLEIGCGKGKFIRETACLNPDINFIGLEKERHVICTAAREAKGSVNNLYFLCSDVKDLEDIFGGREISRIYINFCDPWTNKRKWAKRRLTYAAFLDVYKKLMLEGGEIHFKTDNTKLFEFSLNQFCERDWKLRGITFDLHNSGIEGNIMTEYEQKFSSIGMNIYRLEASSRP
ncbi:MAG: tRNA (guanosine(46)-N7)-methyltransferase TrmB [Clostridiales bacterium]|jgi:tRNA (guanine-N7-)-methyltransferase|nr:tRNA (guanosine(46)-N7)-methyltransferase TrmB [Clostridiales bacterium]